MTTILQPPALDHDAMMAKRFGTVVGGSGKVERRIVWNLMSLLQANGFRPTGVFDGDDFTEVADAKAAMELIFNLDEASVRFAPSYATDLEHDEENRFFDPREHGVLLVLGNGVDCICDWNYTEGDEDGFNRTMDAFNPEAFE